MLPRDFLYNWRQKSWDRAQEIGLSTISLPEAAVEKTIEETPDFLKECSYRCVFIDGFFAPELSHLPSSLICLPLDQAMRSYGVFLQNRISRTLKEETDPFAALNGAFQGKGVLFYIPPQFQLEERLEIHHHFSTEQMAAPRIHLYLGRNSALNIVQTLSFSQKAFCANAFFDATLDENSSLDFCDAQTLPEESRYFQSIRATLKKDSRFASLALMQGAKTARTSYKVQLAEENSEALLQGLSQLKNERKNEIHALVEHIAPYTRSRQTFKSVLYGKSRSSFEGKIFVLPAAQKTEAYQLSANLPLSPDAEVHSKPNLEIFADDVKASHGATIAQIAEEDLFYLRSRGLSLEEARHWLIKGFCRDLIDQVPLAVLKEGFENA